MAARFGIVFVSPHATHLKVAQGVAEVIVALRFNLLSCANTHAGLFELHRTVLREQHLSVPVWSHVQNESQAQIHCIYERQNTE